jgi:FAD/FMN-containing dehydrogenase
VIGLRVVAADGQLIRGGGKVVKNVAGYDLVKLYIGSLGTLGIIVDATLKLRPGPRPKAPAGRRSPRFAGAAAAAASIAASELGPTALVLLDARAARARRPARGCPPRRCRRSWSGSTGSPARSRGKGDETARRLRATGAQAVDVLDAGGTARALEAVREARRLLPTRSRSRPWECCRRLLGAYLDGARMTAEAAGFELAAVAQAGQGQATLVLAAGAPRPAPAPPPCSPHGARARGREAGTSPSSGRRSACARPARCGIRRPERRADARDQGAPRSPGRAQSRPLRGRDLRGAA